MNRTLCPVGKLASPVGRVTSKAADRHKLREIVSALFAAPAIAFAATATSELPKGGQVVTGLAQIDSKGARMDIKQASSRAVIDWSSFNIGAQAQVHFDQPSGGASLNRVYDSKASQIYGKLSATGQVFLVNPNGVVFAPGAQVDVGGLVVSTLSIAKTDFMSANLKFEGGSSNAIINQGNIKVATGGTAAFIAAKIINDGRIEAAKGNVLMAAGSKVTLDLGGPVKLQVDNSTLETLISNGGAIKAEGGHVLLSSQAAATLASSVINNSGKIEAQALASGETGEIILYAHGGTTKISGSLDAKGGFIETSGQSLAIANDTRIKARTWLIDPSDVVINTSSDAIGGATVGASVIQTALSASAGNTDV
ncbi:MAG: filamentous hemagglutinin N-terminal domain-containing protein, partial [Burkholderiales bacterium]|nr:filamentous hemagglutinin N-terminal domain-containing protein [Burkholderiales bacterium]